MLFHEVSLPGLYQQTTYTKPYSSKRNFTILFLKFRLSAPSCAYTCYAAIGVNQAGKMFGSVKDMFLCSNISHFPNSHPLLMFSLIFFLLLSLSLSGRANLSHSCKVRERKKEKASHKDGVIYIQYVMIIFKMHLKTMGSTFITVLLLLTAMLLHC